MADPAPTTVAIVTLGCGRNEVDSQNAAGLLAAAGYQVVADPEQADAVVVNTCAFVEAAKRESIETVLDAAALKDHGRARTVLGTGCLAEPTQIAYQTHRTLGQFAKKAQAGSGSARKLADWRRSASRSRSGLLMRLEHDLDALILLGQELSVSLRRFVQAHAMRDDETGIDLPFLDALQQWPQITLNMALPGFDG